MTITHTPPIPGLFSYSESSLARSFSSSDEMTDGREVEIRCHSAYFHHKGLSVKCDAATSMNEFASLLAEGTVSACLLLLFYFR